MRFFVILLLVLTACREALLAGTVPLTIKEIGLMLRSGYSNEAVLRELSSRHIAGVLDTEAEKVLSQAGANAALLDELRNPAYQASVSEVSALGQKRNNRQLPARVEAPPAASIKTQTTADSAEQTPPADQVSRVLKGNLVSRQSGVLAPLDDGALDSKKLFLYFISANWSPAGRNFTSHLIEYYNRVVKQHPEFEIVFFSADRSEFGMKTYMNQSNMPWPAVTFVEISAQVAALQIDVTHNVPALILLDGSGKLLSRSQEGADLDKVLSDLDKIFAQAKPLNNQ